MSAGYRAVGWSPGKKRYDLAVAAAIALFLASFAGVGLALRPEITAETLLIRGFGLVALLLLHVVLAIGPLCRLDRRFLPLLYNRRHLGVVTFLLALVHGGLAVFQFQHRHAADRIDFQPAVGVGGDREIFAAMRNIEQGHRHGDATRIGRQVATDQFQHAKGSAYGCSVAASP